MGYDGYWVVDRRAWRCRLRNVYLELNVFLRLPRVGRELWVSVYVSQLCSNVENSSSRVARFIPRPLRWCRIVVSPAIKITTAPVLGDEGLQGDK